MKKKQQILGIGVCMLMIIATILPVAGTQLTNENQVNANVPRADGLMMPSGREPQPVLMPSVKLMGMLPRSGRLSSGNSPVPDYEFVKLPTAVMTSYSDYMMGSYSGHPISSQTDNGDGTYMTFHAMPTSSAQRRQYYAYVDGSYNIQSGLITSYDARQGFGVCDVHPATGDAIVSWHETADYTTSLTYDDYAAQGAGHWKTPLKIPLTEDNHYIWPYVYVGPSPFTGWVRVYQIANNEVNLPGDLPSEDVRLMYTDIPNEPDADLNDLLALGNWNTVHVFDTWREAFVRPFQSFAIDYNHPGTVGFIGFAAYLDDDPNKPVDEGAFVWESHDYGVTWDVTNLHTDGPGDTLYYVQNPGYFSEAPDQMDVFCIGYHNTAVYDSEGNLHGTFLQTYGFPTTDGMSYYPYFMPEAEMVWDGNGFTFHEVPALRSIDPLSGHTVPWDETGTFPVIGWSTYPPEDGSYFHENTQKQAINVENEWIAQLWADGTLTALAAIDPTNYSEYLNHPVITLSVSSTNGRKWSEPINLTDINSELFDFSDQITVYPYLGRDIVDLGDNWGLISIYYFDDNDWGSNVQGQGPNTGGTIRYCAVKIKFPEKELVAETNGPYQSLIGTNIAMSGSARYGTPEYTFDWEFGDGTTASGPNVTHTYSRTGTFSVNLTVTDQADPQGQVTVSTSATIFNALTCDAGGPYSCLLDDIIHFQGSATGGIEPYFYTWDLGNGIIKTDTAFNYKYNHTGVYTVTLTVKDSAKQQNQYTDHTTATVRSPIEITLKGGFGVTITAKNNGTKDFTNVNWTIKFDGGIIIIPPQGFRQGIIASLAVDEEKSVPVFVFGFAKSTTITVTVGTAEEIATAKVILFFVLGLEPQ